MEQIIERRAIKDTVANLSNQPLALANFLIALDDGTHKKWYEFKQAVSRIVSIDFTGRAIPIKKRSTPIGNAQCYGIVHFRDKEGLKYTPQLNFSRCKTIQDRINVIMAYDCSPEIKADLLGGVF